MLPGTQPSGLRVDFCINPVGVDSTSPRLGWIVPESIQDGQRGYQVCIATSRESLRDSPDLWDSGRVNSTASQFVKYEGKPLASAQSVWWRVRVWDADGPSDWSNIESWTMGILTSEEWHPAGWVTAVQACLKAGDIKNPDGEAGRKAQPIGIDCSRWKKSDLLKQHVPAASIQLRKTFTVRPNLTRAILFSTGLAHYEATIDGKAVSDRLLSPGWTNYRKCVLYDTTNVVDLLRTPGEHRVDLLLGNGMYNVYYTPDRYVKFCNTFGAQKAIALLQLDYADGSVEKVATDSSWLAANSPITYSNVYGGEDYNQQIEPHLQWANAIPVVGPGGKLRGLSASAPIIKQIERLKPVKIDAHSPNTTIYDFGQNASVMPKLLAGGPAGSSITITPSELLASDGSVDRASCVQDAGGPAYWKYVFDGQPPVNFFPKFFYQGARYFQVEREPNHETGELPIVQDVEAVVVHSSAEPCGTFKCSNELFNRIWTLIRWAQRSNMMHVMTDCPAREKLGWLEQLHLNGPSLRYNFRLDQFYRKVLQDIVDSQGEVGYVPNIAPEFFSADAGIDYRQPFRCSTEWGSSLIIAAWQQYLFHADVELLDKHLQAMVRYFDFLTSSLKDGLSPGGLGDWYDLGPKPPWGSQLTPPPFTASAIYFYNAQILEKVALLLGRKDLIDRCQTQAARSRAAIDSHFLDPRTRLYTRGFPYPQGSQCATAMALALEIAHDDDRPVLVQALIDDIRSNHNGLTAGDVGYRFVLRALAQAGRSDVIYDMNTNPNRPGYAMQLARGATSLTEKWDASVGAFGSQNHFMLGQLNEWLFHDLAGIQPDPKQPGFKHVIFKPQPCGDVTSLQASYAGPYGLISVAWKRTPNNLDFSAVVPANSTATAILPGQTVPIELKSGSHQMVIKNA